MFDSLNLQERNRMERAKLPLEELEVWYLAARLHQKRRYTPSLLVREIPALFSELDHLAQLMRVSS